MTDASLVTSTPGTTEMIARTPNRVAEATPADAPKPATAKTQPATPSRGPHPPMFSGMDAASMTMSARASSRIGGMLAPTAVAAMAKVATWQHTKTTEAAIAWAEAAREPRPARS